MPAQDATPAWLQAAAAVLTFLVTLVLALIAARALTETRAQARASSKQAEASNRQAEASSKQAAASAEQASASAVQAEAAQKSIVELRRQRQFESAPALNVQPDLTSSGSGGHLETKFLISCASQAPAFDVRLTFAGERDRGEPENLRTVISSRLAVVAPGAAVPLTVNMDRLQSHGGRQTFTTDWVQVTATAKGLLGVTVMQIYDWAPNDDPRPPGTGGLGDRWILRQVDVTPGSLDDGPVRFTTELL